MWEASGLGVELAGQQLGAVENREPMVKLFELRSRARQAGHVDATRRRLSYDYWGSWENLLPREPELRGH